MSRTREQMEKELRELLAEEYGIMNNSDLERAIREMKKPNLAIFLVPYEKSGYDELEEQDDRNTKVS